MNQAIYRGIFTRIKDDTEILALLNIVEANYETDEAFTKAKFARIIKYIPTDFIDMPRIIIMGAVYSSEHSVIPFLDRTYIRILVQSNDMTGRVSEKLLDKIRELIDGYTPPILSTDNVSHWTEFSWKRGSKPLILHADVYELYSEFEISVSSKPNMKINI